VKVLDLSDTERAYLAGIVDSEGCIYIVLRRDSKTRRARHTMDVVIVQSHEQFLLYWQRKTGIGAVYEHDPKGAYQWRISSKQAETFLRSILKFMMVKRDQAEIALRFRETVGKRGGDGRLSAEVVQLREEYRRQLQVAKTVPSPLDAVMDSGF
jgi:hypothetical protein